MIFKSRELELPVLGDVYRPVKPLYSLLHVIFKDCFCRVHVVVPRLEIVSDYDAVG